MRMLTAIILGLAFAAAAPAEPIRVAAAISLKEAMTQIAGAYALDTGEKVELTFASSGQLLMQIKAGAPIDAFISAGNGQVEELIRAGLVDGATRRVIAANALVLIVPADSRLAITGFHDLARTAVTRIAAGEPRTVPAGHYAEQTFKSLGLTDGVKDKLVYGASVRQVLDYVERGEVAAGVVYKTDAMESGKKVKAVATAPPESHEPIVYPAVVVKASAKREAAARFLDFLGGESAWKVLEARGFTRPKATAATAPASRPASRPKTAFR
jgi:molybdate transport system substrate-binding protein